MSMPIIDCSRVKFVEKNISKRIRRQGPRTALTITILLLTLLLQYLQPVSAKVASDAPDIPDTPVTITDNSGQQVTVNRPFQRIISLYSAHTENLCSFGVMEQLVGISSSDDYPQEVLGKPRFSYREDPEKFIAARADLVLIRPMVERSYPQFVEKLRNAGITVVSLQPNGLNEMYDYWRNLGRLCGKEDRAESAIKEFQHFLEENRKKIDAIPADRKPGVYFESIHAKMKTFAPDSIALFVLEQAGGRNIATDSVQVRQTNIANYGKEKLLSHAQEIDVFLAQVGRMNPVDVKTIADEPGFAAIKAVADNNIHLIDETLVSRPTLRIREGITAVSTLLYPNQQTREPGAPQSSSEGTQQ